MPTSLAPVSFCVCGVVVGMKPLVLTSFLIPEFLKWNDELRTIKRDNLRDRHKASLRSRLSLTEFGRDVVAHEADFSRHNPIDRWWGGTHLTNDRLWCCDPVLTAPRAKR